MVKWNSLVYVSCEDHEQRYRKKSSLNLRFFPCIFTFSMVA